MFELTNAVERISKGTKAVVDPTKFLREFIFGGLAIFCVLRELIFAIRTDWFFLLGINFCDFRKYPVPSIDNIFVFIE